MAAGIDMRAMSKSIVEQLDSSDVEELNYILKDTLKGKFQLIFLINER